MFWHSEEAIFCNVFTMLVWAMGLKLQERERKRETKRERESGLSHQFMEIKSELHFGIFLSLVYPVRPLQINL